MSKVNCPKCNECLEEIEAMDKTELLKCNSCDVLYVHKIKTGTISKCSSVRNCEDTEWIELVQKSLQDHIDPGMEKYFVGYGFKFGQDDGDDDCGWRLYISTDEKHDGLPTEWFGLSVDITDFFSI